MKKSNNSMCNLLSLIVLTLFLWVQRYSYIGFASKFTYHRYIFMWPRDDKHVLRNTSMNKVLQRFNVHVNLLLVICISIYELIPNSITTINHHSNYASMHISSQSQTADLSIYCIYINLLYIVQCNSVVTFVVSVIKNWTSIENMNWIHI